MSGSMGGGFSAPTSATSGLANYGGDGGNPKAKRKKSWLQRTALKHRAANPSLGKNLEDTMMKTYEELMVDLRKTVDDTIGLPEDERNAALEEAFTKFDEGLAQEIELAVADSDPMVDFVEGLAKSAGGDEELEKGLTDVADFAFALKNIEGMMERMASIALGKSAFPSSLGPDELDAEDKAAQQEHADAILDIVTPYYSLGLTVLQQLTGATIAQEEGDVQTAEQAEEVVKADMAQLFSALSKFEITPEDAFERLEKAFPPDGSTPPPAPAAGDDMGEGDGQEAPDDSDVDPLETMKRLAAAIILQVDAIQQADGGGEEDPTQDANDPTSGAMAQGNPPPQVTKAELNNLLAKSVDEKLETALAPLIEENQRLQEQLETLGKRAAPTDKGGIGVSDNRSNQTIEERATELAKMDPASARTEIFKAALSNPS